MIRHHLTLEHIAHALHTRLQGAMLLEAFSQEKNVLTLCFLRDAQEMVVTISVDPLYGTIMERTNVRRARRNALDRFAMLAEQQCLHVTKHPHDRIITFWFPTYTMHALMFGAGRGNVIVTEGSDIIDALHNTKQLIGTTFAVAEAATPPLGAHYEAEQAHVTDVVEACRNTSTYYVLKRHDDVLFALLPLHGWTVVEATTDLFQALRMTVTMRRTSARLRSMRAAVLTELRRRIDRTQRSISGMQADVAREDRATLYRHYGDILMALPRQTLLADETLTTTDWDGVERTIRVDPARSVIDNAAVYYAKAKHAQLVTAERMQRLPVFEQRLVDLQTAHALASTTQDLDVVNNLHATYMQQQDRGDVSSQYRVFQLDDTYTLYVGKSAANNDELTMRFAKQNDWWFHARGVSGSHAVLRGGPNERPPKPILEQAAAIAAYYSQARNASYTPVVYTQRKYVRKPKGANVGAVVLEREQVVMVKPALPGGAVDHSSK